MEIRELTPADYDAVIGVWSRAALPYRPHGRDARERFCREVGQPSAVFLGAEVEDRLIAVVLGTHDGRKGWINRLAVEPEWRRRGVGNALVAEAERRFADLGIQMVTCLIEDDNETSMAFFRALGYVAHPEVLYFSKRSSTDW